MCYNIIALCYHYGITLFVMDNYIKRKLSSYSETKRSYMKNKTSEILMMLHQEHIAAHMKQLSAEEQLDMVAQIDSLDLSVLSAGDISVSGPSSPQVHPLHKHSGSSKPLCPREGSHVASQVLHRGVFRLLYFLLSLTPSFLRFFFPPPTLSSTQSFFPRDFPFSSLLKAPTVSPPGPFSNSG